MPQLDLTSRDDIDNPIAEADLLDARAFPSGKAPGPDEFGCKFYKAFHEKVVPLMLRMVTDSIKNMRLPSSLNEADICLLLKKGKDETDPASYRPISLLNCDHKVIT